MATCIMNNDSCILKRKRIYIEIPVFLIYFAFSFADSITTSFVRYRTCHIILGLKESDCAHLDDNNSTSETISPLERKVHPSAIVITSTVSIIQSLIPPLLCLFMGPWCNQYGRKPIMLYSTSALVIQYATMIFISAVPNISPWYILLSQLLVCASGGIPALVAAMFTYLIDIIPEDERGMRIALLEATRSCGALIGVATGVVALRSTSYVTVYSLSVAVLVLSLTIIWMVPESIQLTQLENKNHSFFDFASLASTARVTFKSRENYNRTLLLTLVAIIVFYVLATSGNSSVSSMYFQNRFHWNSISRVNYSIVINVTTLLGGLICVYVLHLKLNCGELTGVVAGVLSLLSGSFVLAMATTTYVIHFGGCMQCFGPAVLSMAKSMISKLIPHEDVSTVFAVVAALETVFALVGASLFAVIYNSTSSSNPAMFLYVITGLYFLQLFAVSVLFAIQRYWSPLSFSPMVEEEY